MMQANHSKATVAQRARCPFRSCRIAHAPRRVFICRSGAPPAFTEKASLLSRMGGKEALEVAVDKFYSKVVTDDRIKHFFEGVDMKKQRGHQVAFLSFALGGQKYTGRSMEAAHRGLAGLNDTHFDAVVENLAATLQEMGVSDDLIAEAGAVVETTRDAVLNRHANN